jgi:hypothetical protein
MVGKRRASGLKRALEEAQDPELRDLKQQIRNRQESFAQLELELIDTRSRLGCFEYELSTRLGPLQDRVAELEKELDQLRRLNQHRAQWGTRADSPGFSQDAEEQFRRAWTQTNPQPKTPPSSKLSPENEVEIKKLFRQLAKKFHPDLVTDQKDKEWRARIMVRVNEAYSAGDLSALHSLLEQREPSAVIPPRERWEMITSLKAELNRLEKAIQNLEIQLQRLINSPQVKMMLDASIARTVGNDFIGELEMDLQAEIARLQVDLAGLR